MRINECAEWLRRRNGFLILSHHRPDGDALGTAAALCIKLGATPATLDYADLRASLLKQNVFLG